MTLSLSGRELASQQMAQSQDLLVVVDRSAQIRDLEPHRPQGEFRWEAEPRRCHHERCRRAGPDRRVFLQV